MPARTKCAVACKTGYRKDKGEGKGSRVPRCHPEESENAKRYFWCGDDAGAITPAPDLDPALDLQWRAKKWIRSKIMIRSKKATAGFQRVTGHVIGSRRDGEGPLNCSSAYALHCASTLGHAYSFVGDAICVCEVLRRASPARLRRDDMLFAFNVPRRPRCLHQRKWSRLLGKCADAGATRRQETYG